MFHNTTNERKYPKSGWLYENERKANQTQKLFQLHYETVNNIYCTFILLINIYVYVIIY